MPSISSLPPPSGLLGPPDPTADQQRFWSDSKPQPELRPADVRLIVAALAIGLSFDLAVRRSGTTVATAGLIATTSVALLASLRLITRSSRIAVAVAPLFGVWTMLRVSPWLIPLDLIAAVALILVGIITSTERRFTSIRAHELVAEPFVLISSSVTAVPFVRRALDRARSTRDSERERVHAIAVGIMLMIPVVAILTALLASGDTLASEVTQSVAAGGTFGHVALFVLGSWVGITLLYRASVSDEPERASMAPVLGSTEATIVLAGIATLYAAFTLLQVVGALGAASILLDDPSATKDWAREGFFQLLGAAGITLSVLMGLDRMTRHRQRGTTTPIHRRLRIATSMLTLVIVAMSIARIVMYSDAFGLTMLRLYSILFAGWIAVVFVLYAVRSALDRGGQWLSSAAGAVGLALLLALNVANPEAIVAEYDTHEVSTIDVDYLTTDLSVDAVPTIVDALDDLEPSVAQAIVDRLCEMPLPPDDRWLSWNRSRALSRARLATICPGG